MTQERMDEIDSLVQDWEMKAREKMEFSEIGEPSVFAAACSVSDPLTKTSADQILVQRVSISAKIPLDEIVVWARQKENEIKRDLREE